MDFHHLPRTAAPATLRGCPPFPHHLGADINVILRSGSSPSEGATSEPADAHAPAERRPGGPAVPLPFRPNATILALSSLAAEEV